MTRAFIFPGQGSQFIGMGKDLAESYPQAKQTFQEVDDALGQDLSGLMFGGEEADLNLTENTQPALMAVSMAVVNVLKANGVKFGEACAFMAGHSLGEYSALTAAGALELSDTARLLRTRGQAMQKAVPVGEGSMAAILGLDLPDVQDIANKAQAQANQDGGKELVCQAANDNSVGQVVVSGSAGAVQMAVDIATEAGAKRAVILPVSAPFHCSLMAPAAQAMSYALADTNFRPPCVPVVANVTARGETEPSDIRRLLVDQITGMVRWRESVLWMGEQGVTEMVELGAGKVLNGLVKRINKDIACESVGTPEQVDALIQSLT
ncbi:MAG TPA: ACP S-malonyltransferase [Alphaproteobacteria bacterium]|nr:ACP S-malonyltransferase [Alphaproteobacteria bacterium]